MSYIVTLTVIVPEANFEGAPPALTDVDAWAEAAHAVISEVGEIGLGIISVERDPDPS